MPILKNSILFFLLISIAQISTNLFSQEVPQAINNYGIYDFLDELANLQIIEINSAIKPYSRLFIAKQLQKAQRNRDMLSIRQQKELDFYLLDFGKEDEEWLRAQGSRTAQG